MHEQIAKTILEQIFYQDPAALTAWGARQFEVIKNGVKFHFHTPKYSGNVFVTIELNSMDTYDIKVWKMKGGKKEQLDSKKDIYFDMLIETLDSLIDEKEKIFF